MGFFDVFKKDVKTVETDLLEAGRSLGVSALSVFHEVVGDLEEANTHVREAADVARADIEYYKSLILSNEKRVKDAVAIEAAHVATIEKVKALLP